MKYKILQDIKGVARKDFTSVRNYIKKETQDVTASVDSIRFSVKGNTVVASCDFRQKGSDELIEASINYGKDSKGIYSDCDVSEVSEAILSAIRGTTITAADENEDAMGFDDPSFEDDFGAEFGDDEDLIVDENLEVEDEEYEDPESDPAIETDNNIAGHYIVECDRCHGVFISALMESEQPVEYLTGICPLCEKESDQYVKWVVKSVEF